MFQKLDFSLFALGDNYSILYGVLHFYLISLYVFQVAQKVKNLPAVQETWVQSLSCKDLLEEEMATYFNILAWRIPWTEEPVWLSMLIAC